MLNPENAEATAVLRLAGVPIPEPRGDGPVPPLAAAMRAPRRRPTVYVVARAA
jgi:hypothetical protein